MKWSEGIWSMTKCLKVEGSEKWGVKWRSLVERVYLPWTYSSVVWMWITVQYVLLLSHCLLAICFMSFVLCYVLINCFMFLNLYLLCCFLVLHILLSILCVLCFCIVSPLVYSRLFSICVQFYWPLPPGGNPFPVKKYHIKYSNNNTDNVCTNITMGCVCIIIVAFEEQ